MEGNLYATETQLEKTRCRLVSRRHSVIPGGRRGQFPEKPATQTCRARQPNQLFPVRISRIGPTNEGTQKNYPFKYRRMIQMIHHHSFKL
jgi:hypothetical protein